MKTTRYSSSQLELTPVPSNTAMLRIARIDDAVITQYKLPGADWVVHRRFQRADRPQTLHFPSGLEASFDYARFARPQLPAALQGIDLVNVASDAQLLRFLGDLP